MYEIDTALDGGCPLVLLEPFYSTRSLCSILLTIFVTLSWWLKRAFLCLCLWHFKKYPILWISDVLFPNYFCLAVFESSIHSKYSCLLHVCVLIQLLVMLRNKFKKKNSSQRVNGKSIMVEVNVEQFQFCESGTFLLWIFFIDQTNDLHENNANIQLFRRLSTNDGNGLYLWSITILICCNL